VIRDMYPPTEAQKVMSMVTMFFGMAPMVAPLVGGLLFVFVGWRSVFWFLAAVGAALWISNQRLLPETLHHSQRQMTQWTDNRNHLLDDVLNAVIWVLVAQMIGIAPSQFVAVVAIMGQG
jgi:MFS family permease